LFQTSLRDWQARYRARQALLADEPAEQAATATAEPPRQKRLVARRKRAQRQ
jgi:hypothetical protein